MQRSHLLGLNQFTEKEGIVVVQLPTFQKANEILSEILNKYSDKKTALFLSGGTTPKRLYEKLAGDKTLKAGAVGLIDERYSTKDKRNSNELMIRSTGLLSYFENKNVRFYPILQDKNIEQTTKEYDEALRFIFEYFPKSVGILGIGDDGHTAGIPARAKNSKLKTQSSENIVKKMMEDQSGFVDFYELEGYGQRITMNFHALSLLDLILILVLGREKREALKLMFDPSTGSGQDDVSNVPARFYKKPEVAQKTILITDQII